RDDGAPEARRNLGSVTPLEVLDRGDTRVGTDAGDLPRLAGTSDVDEDRRHPGDADHVGMDDAERDPGGDAGIDRVAAGAQAAGGAPVLLPPHLDEATRAALWTRLDALVLSGGGDVDPARFGEPPHAKVYEVSPERDELELGFTRRALDDGVPLLAICRGIQVLNIALGGTLHQDIPSEPGSAIDHSQKAPRHQPTHRVKVMGEGTRLGSVV